MTSLPYFNEPPYHPSVMILKQSLDHHESCNFFSLISLVGLSLGYPKDYFEDSLPYSLATSMDIFLVKYNIRSSTLPDLIVTSTLRLCSRTHF